MTGNLTSAVTNIQTLDRACIQINWVTTGSPVGTFSVQISADYAQDNEGNVTNAGNWAALTLSPTPDTTLTSPTIIDLQNTAAPWIRVVYTRTSGGSSSSLCNIFIAGKRS